MAHEGGWFGIKNFLFGSGTQNHYWGVRGGETTGANGFVPASSFNQLQAWANNTAKIENGDPVALQNKFYRDAATTVAVAVLAGAMNTSGGMFKKANSPTQEENTSASTSTSTSKQVAAANNGKFGGRSIIVDENLSPKLVSGLKTQGYNVKTFPKSTLDVDIIAYAEKNKSIVLTNNIKDFNKWGVTTFKVSENMKGGTQIETVIKAINNVSEKSIVDPSIVAPGKNISLTEHK